MPFFFKCINKIEIAAGVIPETLDAWPILSGLSSFNLSVTSFDNPLISE